MNFYELLIIFYLFLWIHGFFKDKRRSVKVKNISFLVHLWTTISTNESSKFIYWTTSSDSFWTNRFSFVFGHGPSQKFIGTRRSTLIFLKYFIIFRKSFRWRKLVFFHAVRNPWFAALKMHAKNWIKAVHFLRLYLIMKYFNLP